MKGLNRSESVYDFTHTKKTCVRLISPLPLGLPTTPSDRPLTVYTTPVAEVGVDVQLFWRSNL